MQFGPAARATCAALLLAAAVALVALSMRSRTTEGSALKAFLAVAVLMLGAATIEVFGVAHRLLPGGIERVAPGRTRGILRWANVVDVEWSPRTQWYEVRTRDGEMVRVYQQLGGIAAFARAALDGLPAEVLEARPELRQQLEATARGLPAPASFE